MTAPDPLADIRRLYFAATKATIARDFEHAVDLLKTLPDEEARSRAAVFMDGLAEMRKDWGGGRSAAPPPSATRSPAARSAGSRSRRR